MDRLFRPLGGIGVLGRKLSWVVVFELGKGAGWDRSGVLFLFSQGIAMGSLPPVLFVNREPWVRIAFGLSLGNPHCPASSWNMNCGTLNAGFGNR